MANTSTAARAGKIRAIRIALSLLLLVVALVMARGVYLHGIGTDMSAAMWAVGVVFGSAVLWPNKPEKASR